MPSKVAAIHRLTGWKTRRWTATDHLAGIALVPVPVELFGHTAELDDQVAGQVLRLGLAPFLAPEAQQGGLVIPHDDPGVRATDEGAAVHGFWLL
jgi:hypothetical protein